MKLCAFMLTIVAGCTADLLGFPGMGIVASIAIMGTFVLYAIEKDGKR